MPDGPWWERDGALARLHRQLGPLSELAAFVDTPALRALRATLADRELAQTPEGQAVLAARQQERAQERHRAAVAAAVARLFAELVDVAPAWAVQKLVSDLAAAVPCLAEQLARERTPGWSTPAEDGAQVAHRRDAYLAGWHAVHQVQPQVRLGQQRLATKRAPASVLSLPDQETWVWQFVRNSLRRRYRPAHHRDAGAAASPIEVPEVTPPLPLLGEPLVPADQSLLVAEYLGEILNELPPDVRRDLEAKVRAKIAG